MGVIDQACHAGNVRRKSYCCEVPTEKLTIAGLFAGVGGIELGFEQAGFLPVFANEMDHRASQTYSLNFGHNLLVAPIETVELKDLPPEVNVLAGGFPCQPFSVAGYRKGFDDERGNVYWDIQRLVRGLAPDVVFLENVKNLRGHDEGRTLRVIAESLLKEGYSIQSQVLNATEHGNVPQNRERIYIIGFRDPVASAHFEWPRQIPLTTKLGDLIDFEEKVDDKYYYTSDRPFFNLLIESVTESNKIYQWRRQYVRENKSGVCPTLTANMGTGGHNVPLILSRHGIRKLTPRECFNLMGFPESYLLPSDAPSSALYKQAGNSVVVPVVKRIAERISHALRQAERSKD